MGSIGLSSRRNACQMFGIYRARTPDKMEGKPSRQTRIFFLTVVITGVTLVVGLSILDVSTNTSTVKSTPVLHLTRHRQSLLHDNSTGKPTENDETVAGIVKEITKPYEAEGQTRENWTDIVTAATVQDGRSENNNSRTGRTQLFTIDRLKSHRTQIVKDYFIDGRHDPKSMGFYILQKQSGEYYLKNYSDPLWGTRIQRRFSNRVYPTPHTLYQNDNSLDFTKRNDNIDYDTLNKETQRRAKQNTDYKTIRDQPYHLAPFRRLAATSIDTGNSRIINQETPPYEFTPIPIFSDSYAQLDPYKNNAKIKSIQDVVKYLTAAPKPTRPSTTSMPRTNKPELFPSETTIRIRNITDSNGQTNKNRKKGIRFSGTYKMPIDSDDLKTGSSGIVETLLPPPLEKPYISSIKGNRHPKLDPFESFRPSDPMEINYMLSGPSMQSHHTNIKKPKQIVPIYGNTYRTSTVQPTRFMPRPPHGTRYHGRPENDEINIHFNDIPSTPSSNSHTVAIFKPTPFDEYLHPVSFPGKRNPNHGVKKKRKPVSVTLDIYPMTMDEDQEQSTTNVRNSAVRAQQGKISNNNENLEWISPTVYSSSGDGDSDSIQSSNSDSHMVVHLNLFPKEVTRKTRYDVKRRPLWKSPPSTRDAFTQQNADYPIEINDNYEDYQNKNYNSGPIKQYNHQKNVDYLDYDFVAGDNDDIPVNFYDYPNGYKKNSSGYTSMNNEGKGDFQEEYYDTLINPRNVNKSTNTYDPPFWNVGTHLSSGAKEDSEKSNSTQNDFAMSFNTILTHGVPERPKSNHSDYYYAEYTEGMY